MRILYWTEAFWPYIGGLEVFSTRLLAALRARGHEILVVTSHANLALPDADDYRGVPVQRFPFQEALATRNLPQVLEIRRRVSTLKRGFAPDVVHVKMTSVATSTLFHIETMDAHLVPTLVTLQGAVNASAGHPETLHGHLLRRANWVTAVSWATLAGARTLVPEIAGRSSVVYNNLDVPRLPPSPLPRERPAVLCVGRLTFEKGFDVAVSALAEVCRRRPDVRLIIGGDGPERHSLERRAAELGLTAQIEFLGWIAPERVPAMMNTASVVVVPSREEAFGIAALEAAAMARPVVATRVGGLPEVVLDGRTGILVEREDVEAMGAAVEWLLGHPEAAARMGDAARRRVIAEFRLEGAVDAYVELYRYLTKEVPHAPAAGSLPPE